MPLLCRIKPTCKNFVSPSVFYSFMSTSLEYSNKEDLMERSHGQHKWTTPKSPEERQAALTAALKIDPGVNPLSLRAFYFYLVVLCVFCCSGDNGFDGTVMSGINAMSQYQ